MVGQRQTFIGVLRELAKMYDADIGPFVLGTYEKTLARFGTERLIQAAERLVVDKKPGSRFPSVSEFLDALGETPLSDEHKAIDTANRIWGAITAKGRGAKHEDLLPLIGEVGVYLAKMHGGWSRLCEETDHLKEPTFWRQQITREAAAYMEKARRGALALPPTFDPGARALPANQKVLEAIGALVGQTNHDQTSVQTQAGGGKGPAKSRPPVA